MKFCIVVYGCLSRSLERTRVNHKDKVFNVLERNNITYDCYYIDNQVEVIDKKKVKPFDEKLVSFKDFIRLKQQEIDSVILKKYPNRKNFFRKGYLDKYKLNPFRNSFIETQVSKLLYAQREEYTHSIVLCADLWFEKKIDLRWSNKNGVIVSDQNPAQGYTNAFYFGKIEDMYRLLETFNYIKGDGLGDYERLIKQSAIKNSIKIIPKNFRFLKIRADGRPAYKGRLPGIWRAVEHIYPDYQSYFSQ